MYYEIRGIIIGCFNHSTVSDCVSMFDNRGKYDDECVKLKVCSVYEERAFTFELFVFSEVLSRLSNP